MSPKRSTDPASGLRYRCARDPLVRSIRDAARETGTEVWLVGGYVRDFALGARTADVDLAAGRGAGALVRRLQTDWKRKGFRFRKRGVTTWRVRVGDREVDLVDASRRGLDADLRRRELTINAMAFDLRAGRLIDPLHGLRDLRAGRLRAPGDGVMRDDPVRALRLARFLANLPGFRLDPETRAQASAVAGRLGRASAERVRDELDRLLVSAAPRRGLSALEDLGLLEAVLPELVPLRDCVAGRDRPDVWSHTLDAIDEAVRIRRLPGASASREPRAARVLRWSLLLHDIAKPETLARAEDGRPTFHGHEVLGARRARGLMDRLVQPRWLGRRVARVVLYHLRPHQLADAGAPARGMRRLVREAAEDLPVLLVHAAADARASGAPDAARKWRTLRPVLGELETIYRRSLSVAPGVLVGGDDVMKILGVGPGPGVGRVLSEIRDLQAGGALTTREQALAFLEKRSRGG